MIEVVLLAAGLASPASLAVSAETMKPPTEQRISVGSGTEVSASERMSSTSATFSWIPSGGSGSTGIDDWRQWD